MLSNELKDKQIAFKKGFTGSYINGHYRELEGSYRQTVKEMYKNRLIRVYNKYWSIYELIDEPEHLKQIESFDEF
jgi:hypothetical protein